MDCFLDAMFRTTGVDKHATTPKRNQLAPERTKDDGHLPATEDPEEAAAVVAAATAPLVFSEHIHARALHWRGEKRKLNNFATAWDLEIPRVGTPVQICVRC